MRLSADDPHRGNGAGGSGLILATMDFPPRAGGIQQVCVELSRALCRLGIAVHVLAPSQPGDADFDRGEPYAVTRYRAGRTREPVLALALLRALRDRPRPVLFAQWTGALLGALPRSIAGLPRFGIITHGKELLLAPSGLRGGNAFAAVIRTVLNRADVVFAVSEFTAGLAQKRGAHPSRVRRLHLGVDAEIFFPDAAAMPPEICSAPGPFIVTIARLVPRKGIDTAIHAVAELTRDRPELTYLVIGDGPDRARLQSLVTSCGLQDRVHLLGELPADGLRRVLRAADLFVLDSREEPRARDVEGFGLVLLEAQASGVPVIAARSGGMPDALREGESGLLVPQDDPHALARAIRQLLSDPQRLERMGRSARAFALAHPWQRTAEEIRGALMGAPSQSDPAYEA
jgi:phosphatidyl-myo-inositol dimannoside synthase